MENTVAVIGAGVMGTGLAHNLTQYGINTVLIDKSNEQLDKSHQKILTNLRLYKLHEAHMSSDESQETITSRLTLSTQIEDASSADLVIENITENWDLKKQVYRELDQVCKPDTVYGVNTSAISITKIASLMTHPENVVGAHFMNPVPLKPMVELIRAVHTSNQALGRLDALCKHMNKKTLTVNDSPGFVTNRCMMIFVNEAIFLLHEGVASVEDIDELFKDCFGHKMGPLQTADLIGLDTILKSLDMLYEGFNDDKYRPCFHLKKMVDAGYLGMKSGQGFYQYT